MSESGSAWCFSYPHNCVLTTRGGGHLQGHWHDHAAVQPRHDIDRVHSMPKHILDFSQGPRGTANEAVPAAATTLDEGACSVSVSLPMQCQRIT
jgi:hypothetical protein